MIYRPGPLGAMMGEYERAIEELIRVAEAVDPAKYAAEINPNTSDPNCLSVQTILWHVISSGRSYACYIREAFGMEFQRLSRRSPLQEEIPDELRGVIAYTLESLDGKWHLGDDEIGKILTPVRWNDRYDLEILLEHAIVHVLRHRRQIERLLAL